MQPVCREEILDYVTWTERRPSEQPRIFEAKRKRRVHLGEVLTLLFENRETVRYQIQEMMRVERMVKEAEIEREIHTYNDLLGGPGELGATLLVEIPDVETRAKKLAEWLALPERTYVKLEDGRRIFARFDERQRGAERVSAVQFLKFATGGSVPIAAGVDMPGLVVEMPLAEEQRAALHEDLAA